MRKEADDTGPMAELEHWKMRMAKFNSLVEQIKGADCKAVIRILLIAKSKTLKVTCQVADQHCKIFFFWNRTISFSSYEIQKF